MCYFREKCRNNEKHSVYIYNQVFYNENNIYIYYNNNVTMKTYIHY